MSTPPASLVLAASAGDPSALTSIVLPMLSAVLVVGVAVGVVFWIRARVASRQAARPSPRERIESLQARAAAADDVHAEAARALDTVRRLAAQLDVRAERLNQLIAAADERIDRLEGGTPEARASPSSDPVSDSIHQLAREGRTPVEIAQMLGEPTGKVELILALGRQAG